MGLCLQMETDRGKILYLLLNQIFQIYGQVKKEDLLQNFLCVFDTEYVSFIHKTLCRMLLIDSCQK